MESTEQSEGMERRKFLARAGRWALGLAALGLAGSLASCSSESGTSASDTATSTGTASSSGSGSTPTPQSPSTTTAGATAVVTSKCVGCGKCTRACRQGAISLSGKKAVISEACIGCGDCLRYCPVGAIVLVQSSGGTVTLKPDEVEEALAAA